MSLKKNSLALAVAAAVTALPTSAFATNGMNLEGYGPVAAGMGGASMAYDNGTAAVMNNPATLGLMTDGNRLDAALGYLGPKVTAKTAGQADAPSEATAFYMPAVGWVTKSNGMTYGVAMFAQGGMGTEYAANSFMAANSGEKVRSEVGVGRLIVPFAYNVDNNLTVAATLDYVWAGMDVKMALRGSQFLDMGSQGSQTYGTVSGSMMDSFGQFIQGGVLQAPSQTTTPLNWGRFDFSNDNDFTGQAKGAGFAGKLGGVFKMSKDTSVGVTYHSKTSMGDLEGTGTTTMNVNIDLGLANQGPAQGYTPQTVTLNGKYAVKDFQWPQTFAVGVAHQMSSDLMLVADYKWINWSDSMKNFDVTFTADSTQQGLGAAFAGKVLEARLYQNWEDQNVFQLGAAYKASGDLTVRGGVNIANNPVPDKYMNPLFPAIAKNHITLGAGYALSKTSMIDGSFAYVLPTSQTNGSGVQVDFGGIGVQLMYASRF